VAVLGCGLGDYEVKMQEAQRKALRFEEENKLLDKPITVPSEQKDGTWTKLANLFFRPPRGIQEKHAQQPRANLLWEYHPSGTPGTLASGVFTKVELAIGSGQKDFPGSVLACFQPLEKPLTRDREVTTHDRKLLFKTTEFDDVNGSHVSINLYTGGSKPVAIAFSSAKNQAAHAARIEEVSLGTLGMDFEASRLEAAARRGSPWVMKK
jgi:hypothetical protein